MSVNIKKKDSGTTSKEVKKKSNFGFMKTGQSANQLLEKKKAEAEARKESAGNAFRFYLKKGTETTITFLDGELDENGFFKNPGYLEHNLMLNGKWTQLPCVSENEECPLCVLAEDKDKKISRHQMVFLFTVIDHGEYPSSDGTKVYKDQVRLFVAKSKTLALLTKYAGKDESNPGIQGMTFDVERTDDKNSPAVGDAWMFQQRNDVEDIIDTYNTEQNPVSVLDYEDQITYKTASELSDMGFKIPTAFGATIPDASIEAPKAKAANYEDDL